MALTLRELLEASRRGASEGFGLARASVEGQGAAPIVEAQPMIYRNPTTPKATSNPSLLAPNPTIAATPGATAAVETPTEVIKPPVDNEGPAREYATGPNQTVSNIMGLGNLALGLAGYFENKKTAGLQREALKHDISTAKEHRANRAALGESWAKAWQ